MKKDLAKMRCLDIYLSRLSSEEYQKIEPLIQPTGQKVMPLLSWDIFSERYFDKLANNKKRKDWKLIEKLAKEFHWENDLEEIFRENNFEALVLTDLNQRIIWVNEGFSSMTGYSKQFAKNKTPSFLQGEKTAKDTKEKIARALKRDTPFTEVIVNYKKDKTLYKCEVKIFPLYHHKTTHFLALEKEVIS